MERDSGTWNATGVRLGGGRALALLVAFGMALGLPVVSAAQNTVVGEVTYRVSTGPGTCLNLRPEPVASGEPIDCLEHGTDVVAFDSQGEWLALRVVSGQTGWSIARGLELAPPAAPALATSTPSNALPAASPPVSESEAEMVAPPAPPAAAAKPIGSVGEYTIGLGEVLLVEVFDLSELNRKVRVLRDGTISLPLLGNFRIAGLSVAQAEKKISDLLKERGLVKDPQVSIFVEEFVSLGVIIQGAVEKPGVYPLTGPKSVLELIGEAGGLVGGNSEAAGNSLYVLRGDIETGRERMDINLEKLIDEGDIALDIPLEPGDIVVVPQSRTYNVFVTGAAVKPGAVPYSSSDGITLLQAVTAAGGPSERANLSSLYVLRNLPDGSQERIKANLKKIGRGREPDIPLQKNDVVVIGEWIL